MESERTALETGLTAVPPESDEEALGQAPGHPCLQLPPLATPWHRQGRCKAKAVLPEKKNSCPRQWLFLSMMRMDIWTDIHTCAYTKLQQELGPAVTGHTGSAWLWPNPHLWQMQEAESEPLPLGLSQHSVPTPICTLNPLYHCTIWVDSNIHTAPPAHGIVVVCARIPCSQVSLDKFMWTTVVPLNFSAGLRNQLTWPARAMHPAAAGNIAGTSVLCSTHVPGEMPLSPFFLTWISHVTPPGAQQRNLARCFNFLVFTALIALD